MNLSLNKPATVIENNLDGRWSDATVYNHYDNPLDFMHDVIDSKHLAEVSSDSKTNELLADSFVITHYLNSNNYKMAQMSLAWLWTKGVSSPISLLLKWNILMLHRCFQY